MKAVKDKDKNKKFLVAAGNISPLAKRILKKVDGREILESCKTFDYDGLVNETQEIISLKDESQFQKKMRLVKYRELLKIMIRDVLMKQDVPQTLDELSSLADIVIRAVYNFTAQSFQKNGMPPLSIIAMGKLGSRELNFSSDVDLVYVYKDTDMDNVEIYSKWAVKINQLLTAVTEDGFLYRVDNDLRPGGRFSPIAVSGTAVMNFYAQFGETWQRVALLRARCICGDEAFVRELLLELEPYVYRKYLDFAMISELRELKAKINAESLKKDKEGINIKLGQGGIREAEFFVQILQIINGGKNIRLRKVKIAEAVDALVAEKIITREEGAAVKDAYFFLRKVENAIQMEEEQQTYILPSDKEALRHTAGMAGYGKPADFLSALEDRRAVVKKLFTGLFGEKPAGESAGSGGDGYINGKLSSLAGALDWEDSEKVEEYVHSFAELAVKVPAKYKKHYGTFLIELFTRLSEKGRQLSALAGIEDFIKGVVKRPVYIALLAENPKVVEYIVNVFYFGQFLSRILVNHPETLDFIVTRDDVERDNYLSYLGAINSVMGGLEDFEDKMFIVRQYKNSEWLKIGMMDYMGMIRHDELERYLTNLAEASLLAVTDLCREMLNERMEPVEQEYALIGMGKLGSMEMNYFSDLDLIFLYKSKDERAGLYNAKLLQKVISALTMVTREGELYKVDMRLRPTGSQGPLVTTFENFKNYHKTSWIFEKQALTRARVLGEKTPFAREIGVQIDKSLYGGELDDNMLKSEIVKMRERIENELAKGEKKEDVFELKTGWGGLVDIEFIIQYIKLKHGHEHKKLRAVNPHDFFKNLKTLRLYPSEQVKFLEHAYIFLKKIESRIRILSGYSRDSFKIEDQLLDDVMFSMGIKTRSRGAFMKELNELKTRVREEFDKILG